MSNKAFEDLLFVRIPIPTSSDIKIGHGVHSSRVESGGRLKIDTRYNQEEIDLIKQAAKHLELQPSTFVRLCSIFAAKEIVSHVKAYLELNGGG